MNKKEMFLEKAKKEGVKIHKGNPKKAESLNKLCSEFKSKYPIKVKELLNCI